MWLIYRHNETNFIFCIIIVPTNIQNKSTVVSSPYMLVLSILVSLFTSWLLNDFIGQVEQPILFAKSVGSCSWERGWWLKERKHTCHLREKGIMADLFFLFRTSLIIWLILILGEGWWLKMCIKDSILVIFGGGVGFKLDLAFFTRMRWGTLCCSSRVSAGMEHPSWLHMKNNFYWKKF